MLLKALAVTNNRGSVLDLPFDDISGGFIVRGVDGLDPVKATIVSSSFANQDGEQYHSSRREARDIRISLGLDPDYSTQDAKTLRDQLYNFFMPKTQAHLSFRAFDRFTTSVLDQVLEVDIDGRIESFEAPLFVKESGADIVIRCFNPDFVDLTPVTIDGMTVADLTETTHTYKGTVETGVLFELRPDRDISEFTIYHRAPDQSLRTVDFTYPLLTGDVLQINSVSGEKRVTLTRSGVESSILYAVSPQSNWLEFEPGDNVLRVYATGAPVPFSIEYTTKYGGL